MNSKEQSTPVIEVNSRPAPEVSVILLTYRHEKFIAGALRSILSQVDAPTHEILVAEDYSPDGTKKVIRDLAIEFPGRFELLDRGRNLGLSANLEDAWQRCRGQYITILEGDDEWSDPRKLAKVAAAMRKHPDWAGCFHGVRQVNLIQRPIHEFLPVPFPDHPIRFDDLLKENHIPTYSCVTYRRGIVPVFPEWHRTLICGDWGLNLVHSEHGVFGFLPDVMTRYRAHPGGMWSGMGDVHRWNQSLLFWNVVNEHYQGKYEKQIAAARSNFIRKCQENLDDLRKIERRYNLLQLHRVAAAVRWLKLTGQKLFARPN